MISFQTARGFLGELRESLPQAREAARDQGISIPRQICEMVLLRMNLGKLSPADYFMLRLWRRGIPFSEKKTYISDRSVGRFKHDKRWDLVAHDKILAYSVLSSHGIAVPNTLAIVHPHRGLGKATQLKSEEELAAFLRTQAPYPLFSKPATGIYSKNAMILESLDQARDILHLGDGSTLPLKDYTSLASQGGSGFLLQELLHPHPEVRSLCGDRLCTVRMIVFYDRKARKAKPFCALWKIASPENMADNYWRRGNMLALLDLEQGRVERCTTGLGRETREVERHPVSEKPIVGFVLPDWDQTLALTMRAAHAIPGLPVQAWDIALTSKGPVALEVNVFGSFFLPQIAMQSGLYQGEFRAFMEASAS